MLNEKLSDRESRWAMHLGRELQANHKTVVLGHGWTRAALPFHLSPLCSVSGTDMECGRWQSRVAAPPRLGTALGQRRRSGCWRTAGSLRGRSWWADTRAALPLSTIIARYP
jgi:hypothetical protein